MTKDARIYIAGHRGLAGSAILRALEKEGYSNFILKTHKELDLTSQTETDRFFKDNRPEYVFLAAAKVGGILANDNYSADFIYENLMIQTNIINAAHKYNCRKLLFLGSSCIYPKFAPQPMKEDYLLDGKLETTNQAYAIAKIAGIIMCSSYHKQHGSNFISVMPTNLFGPNDNFHLENSHVLPALLRKFHEAKINKEENVTIWGTGKPRREFLYVDDLANACVFLMNNYNDPEIVNIGIGTDVTIHELAMIMKEIVKYEGNILFDNSKPDGTPRKLLDITKISNLGWKPKTDLKEGIRITYEWYINNIKK